jgi:hypothetical protein
MFSYCSVSSKEAAEMNESFCQTTRDVPLIGGIEAVRAFAAATAEVDDALDRLKETEAALEQQLADLRFYLRPSSGRMPMVQSLRAA